MKTYLGRNLLSSLVLITSFSACSQTSNQGSALESAKPASHQEIAQAWHEASKPGPGHKVIGQFAGTWKATVKTWFGPENEPQISEGRAKHDLIFDGRFLKEDFKSLSKSMPFQGMGVVGYDNITNEYTSVWIDTMTTSTSGSVGTYDPATKTISWSGQMPDPVSKKMLPVRSTSRFIDNDNYVYEMYDVLSDGSLKKSLEVNYRRMR